MFKKSLSILAAFLLSLQVAVAGELEEAVIAYNNKEFIAAFGKFQNAAKSNIPIAQLALAMMYDEGIGTPKNIDESIRFLKLAANNGVSSAQWSLGRKYHDGEHINQDYFQAFYWFKLAAENGNKAAQYNLGNMYEKGNGVTQNYSEALRWFKASAEQGDFMAQDSIALMYLRSNGVERDYSKAYMWSYIAVATADKASNELKEIASKHLYGQKEMIYKYLSPDEILNSENLGKKCISNNFKNCDSKLNHLKVPPTSYIGRLRAKVKSNIIFTDDLLKTVDGNPAAEVEVTCNPRGKIETVKLKLSSGNLAWDQAVLNSLYKTEILLLDANGTAPSEIVFSFRPRD
jgi:TPR repeat protein